MKRITRLTFLLIAAGSSSCSGALTSSDRPLDYAAKIWDQQSECVEVWTSLMDSWKANGGGILTSIAATREQIAKDDKSAFARLVRDSWRRQKTGHLRSQLGQWPISDDSARAVRESINPGGLVPKSCRAPIWLDDWLFFQIIDDPKQWTVRRLPEMPQSLDATDHYSASRWLLYWLFVRTDSSSAVAPNNSFKPKPLRGSA